MALLWLAEGEASDAGTATACSFDSTRAVVLVSPVLLWPWCCWQSEEQRRRELEAADAASVARLVRGMCSCPSCCMYTDNVSMCMLRRWWRGQAAAGLLQLRTPAVRHRTCSLLMVVVPDCPHVL